MSGPYETEREAAAAARHIYDTEPGTGAWGTGNLQLLEDACRAAGVQLGVYDTRIVVWLTGWEPATCAVIGGLISRAHALTGAQRAAALDALRDAARWRDHKGGEECYSCAREPGGLCHQHAADLDKSDDYRRVLHELGGQP